MIPIKLTESSSKLTREGNLWEAVLITPGKGSSGIYTEEMLKVHGPKAFPKGIHSYVDHLSEGEQRSPKNLAMVLTEDAHYEDGRGLVGKFRVMKHWADFVEEVAPYTGLSISAMGNGSDTDDGFLVEELIPDIQNTVDLVSYAGRGGALAEKLAESALSAEYVISSGAVKKHGEEYLTSLSEGGEPAVAAVRKQGKDNLLEIEELAKKVDALAESLNTLVETFTPIAESLKAVEESTEEVDVAAAVESAIDKTVEAGIPKELRGPIIEAAKRGEDVDAAIASQKAVVEAVKAHVVTESAGRFGGAADNFNPIVPKWAGK